MSIAFIFPGQGSQAVGMGAELAKAYPAARAVFDEVDAALSQPLSRLMREGPEAELTLTENAQPALMAVSLAAMRVLGIETSCDETGAITSDEFGHRVPPFRRTNDVRDVRFRSRPKQHGIAALFLAVQHAQQTKG